MVWYVARIMSARSHKKRKLFLAELGKGFSESKAAKAAGESVRFFTRWAAEDENFKQDWEDAVKEGDDGLEDVAVRRSKKGSDFLLSQQLKARKPEKYRERSAVEHSGSLDLGDARAKLKSKLEDQVAASEEGTGTS